MAAQTTQLPMLNFRAGLEPTTFDEEKRTVEVAWTTGARGKRDAGWGDFYFEEVAIEPDNIRLDRFIGAPVRDSHTYETVRDTIGVVEDVYSVKSSNGKTKEWRARVRFASQAEDVFKLVREGVVRHVSMGYYVHMYEELEEKQDGYPVFRATDWEPVELSFVNIPFDAKATVRSSENTIPCNFVLKNRSQEMPILVEPSGAPAPAATPKEPVARQSEPTIPTASTQAAQPPVDVEAVRKQERERIAAGLAAIREAAAVAKLNAEDTVSYERMLGEGQGIDEIRALIIRKAAEKQPKIDTTSTSATVGSNLAVDGVERGISEVILSRAIPNAYSSKITDAGRKFQRDSVLRLAERLLEAHGRSLDGMSQQRVISEACKFRSGSHSTSDFYWLFESAVDRILKDEFNKVRLTYLPLARNVELPDFRKSTYVTVGDNFTLQRQDEGEELTYGTFTHDARDFSLATFSRGIKWTRQMMINDDLSVLSRLPDMVSRAGDKLKARMVWGMICGDGNKIGANGITMSDGNPLFASVHGNLAAAGGPINKTTVAAARKAIRKQKAFGGKEEVDTLDLEPKYLIVGPEKEQEAIEFLAANFVAVNQQDAAAINLTRSLTMIVENRIANNAWYLVSPDIDGIITATLQGENGMFLETDSDFETDGFKMKGRMEFGVHMARWEGWYKNPGA